MRDDFTATEDAAYAFERDTSDEVADDQPTRRELLHDLETRRRPVDATVIVCRRCGAPRREHCGWIPGTSLPLDCVIRVLDVEWAMERAS